ncbi:MAG: patatin-like phospholipase family protein [Rhodopila sp.]|jgi:hypothetical protein
MSGLQKELANWPSGLLRRSVLGLSATSGIAALLPGRAIPVRGTPVPAANSTAATVLGITNERFFPSVSTAPLEQEFIAAVGRQRSSQGLSADAPLPELELLALSGGGENGAFGAGLLCGWSAQGTSPVFELVTGVSTGALIAPFAFLGSSYDSKLRNVFTGHSPNEVLTNRFFSAAITSEQPLQTGLPRSCSKSSPDPQILNPAPILKPGLEC